MELLRLAAALRVALASAATLGQSLPGFTLTGENRTCDPGDGGVAITGVLSRLSTNDPLHRGPRLPPIQLHRRWAIVESAS